MGIVVYKVGKNNQSEKLDRTLNYLLENKIYSFIENNNNYKIIIKEKINCINDTCDSKIVDEKEINDEEDCHVVKHLLDEFFKGTNLKEKTVNDNNLTAEQIEKIKEILEDNNIISNLEYEIIKENSYNYSYSKRGYSVEKENDSIIYTIAMGTQPNNGYSIGVSNVEINDNSVTIYVEEKTPIPGALYGQVITYPIVKVKFNKQPNQVSVLNSNTHEKYPEIKI